MSLNVAEGVIGAAGEEVLIPLPSTGRWHVAYHVSGTFVGTLKGASTDETDPRDSMTDRTSRDLRADSSGDPTGTGENVFDAGADAKWARVYFDSYTSGEARVKTYLIPRG